MPYQRPECVSTPAHAQYSRLVRGLFRSLIGLALLSGAALGVDILLDLWSVSPVATIFTVVSLPTAALVIFSSFRGHMRQQARHDAILRTLGGQR